jgi:predicted RNase H-like HicB family nuclease
VSTYAVIIEDAGPNVSAYVPDLPGCTSTGYNLGEVTAKIREAMAHFIESLSAHGEEVPGPPAQVALVDVSS